MGAAAAGRRLARRGSERLLCCSATPVAVRAQRRPRASRQSLGKEAPPGTLPGHAPPAPGPSAAAEEAAEGMVGGSRPNPSLPILLGKERSQEGDSVWMPEERS